MSRKIFEKQVQELEKKNPIEPLEDNLPVGTEVSGFEWTHSDPKICAKLPKRGYCGLKVKIFSFNPADDVKVFTGESNLKLCKCGWCSHLARDCDGANYLRFDLESIAKTRI